MLFFARYFLLPGLVGWFFCKLQTTLQHLIMAIPLSILMGIGILKLGELIAPAISFLRFSAGKISFAVAMIFIMMFFSLSWWSLREYYFNGKAEGQLVKFASAQKNSFDFSKKGVIAVGLFHGSDILSYYFDRNFVYFAPETIEKLIRTGKLKEAFRQYDISGFAGYDDNLTEIINKNTGNKLKNYSVDM